MIRSVLVEGILMVALLAPTVARADDVEEARRRFTLGEEQYARGSYEEAYASYEAAYRAAPLSDFLFNMGQCQRKLGNAVEALALYRRFLAQDPPEDRRVIVEGLVRDMTVTLPVEPEHTPAGGDDAQGGVGGGGGGQRPASIERPGFFARLRAPTWILAASGVVLAGAAGLLTLRAQSGQEDLDALPCERDIAACTRARDDAEPWFLARNVTLAAGGVAIGVAVVLAIVDAGAGSEAGPGGGGVAIVPVVGPSIAAVAARGRF